jgi:hypothetical protein
VQRTHLKKPTQIKCSEEMLLLQLLLQPTPSKQLQQPNTKPAKTKQKSFCPHKNNDF